MQYISTRGEAPDLGFADVLLTGMAADGGLYVPEACPLLTQAEISTIADMTYKEVAQRVIHPFVDDDLPAADLARAIKRAYATFHHTDVVPLQKLDDGFYVQELFYGPTLAFKDVALQLLGQLFAHFLEKRQQRVTIIGATSGDTGSAAIAAFADNPHTDVFILHPRGRVSEVQRRQMTTVQAANVHNIAIEGSFDDCQDMVKALFADTSFRKEMSLSAVNSINWARILAQVVYYVLASCKVFVETGRKVAFSVPTGNFGNVYAGYIALSMGAPIEKLIVATNKNDILHRFFESGEMRQEMVSPTISPSMDIQISSNFERLLFDLYGRNGFSVRQTMKHFRDQGPFRLDEDMMQKLHAVFASGRKDDMETKQVMAAVMQSKNYMLDPHTAVGVGVGIDWKQKNPETPVICLATAHPAKFPQAVAEATGIEPPLPDFLSDLYEREERCTSLPNEKERVQDFIRQHKNG